MSRLVPYRPATDAKAAVERIPGVRAVAFQKARGRTVMVISAVTNGLRTSREVPVCAAGAVADYAIAQTLRGLGLDAGGFNAR